MENNPIVAEAELVSSHTESAESFWHQLKRFWKESWAFYKAHFSKIAWIVAVQIIVAVPVAFMMDPASPSLSLVGAGIGLGILGLIVYGVVYVALLMFVAHDGSLTVKESFSKGLHNIISLGWIMVLSFFAVMGGLLLLAVPGIYLGVAISFGFFVFAKENVRGRDALVRSWSYVSGRWWRVFLLVAVTFIVLGVAGNILNRIFGDFIYMVYSALLSTPLTMIFTYFLYKHFSSTAGSASAEQTAKHVKRVTIAAVLGLVFTLGILVFSSFWVISLIPGLKDSFLR